MLKLFLLWVIIILLGILCILQKQRKNIWQKIEVIYNQIYALMIEKYYTTMYGKKLIKQELKDYLTKVVLKKSLEWLSYFEELERFIYEFIGSNIASDLQRLKDYKNYLKALSSMFTLLVLAIVTLLITLFIL